VQARQAKVDARKIDRRLGAGGSAGEGPPRVVGVLALGDNADAAAAAAALAAAADSTVVSPVAGAVGNPVTMLFRAHKQRMTVVLIPRPVTDAPGADAAAAAAAAADPAHPIGTGPSTDLIATLEAARGCDLVLVVLNVAGGPDAAIDAAGDVALAGLRSAGLPSTAACIQGTGAMAPKARSEARRWAARLVATEMGEQCKVAEQDAQAALVRAVVTARPRAIAWREKRPTLLAHALDFAPDAELTARAHAAGITTAEQAMAASGQPLCPLAVDVAARRRAVDAAAAGGVAAPETFGTLLVSGWLRGPPLSASSLVHLPRMGTFRVARVTEGEDPIPIRPAHAGGSAAEAGAAAALSPRAGIRVDGPLLTETDADASALKSLADPDPEDAEQTWPTAEEEAVATEAEHLRSLEAARKRRGIDDYSSAWLVGEDLGFAEEDEEGDDDDDDDDDDVAEEDDGLEALRGPAGMLTDPPPPDKDDPETRRRLFAEDSEYPDEIDTPIGQTARERFARYRGLESMRTGAWDRHESLPPSYARLFAFSDFHAAKRAAEAAGAGAVKAMALAEGEVMAMERAERSASGRRGAGATGPGFDLTAPGSASAAPAPGYAASVGAGTTLTASATAADLASVLAERTGEALAPPGRFVVLHVANVPASLLSGRPGGLPLLASALMRHEGRTSVLHTQLQRTVLAADTAVEGEEGDDEDDDDAAAVGAAAALASVPIKSKDPLEVHVGPRVVDARPIFSQRSSSGGRHKVKRWMPSNGFVMASLLAPVAFPPLPVLTFRRAAPSPGSPPGVLGRAELVATGSVIGADPHQLLLKRTLLTGAPIRSKKRWAVVQSMFFRPEDVMWFRPVELHTRLGAKGRIRDSVGTHGLFKANFNRPVPQHDTICLPLWKRVYPKWGPTSYGRILSAEDMDVTAPLPSSLRAALVATGAMDPRAVLASAAAAPGGAAAASASAAGSSSAAAH